MVVCFCTVKAQNTTKIVAGANVTISPPSGVGVVTISATGGGGGGAGTLTNVVSTFDIITSSGVGTPIITLSRTPSLTWTNNNGFVDVTGGFNSVQKMLINGSGLTNDWGNGILYGSLGSVSVNYNGRTLNREGGNTIFDFQNSIINDTAGSPSVDANNHRLKITGIATEDWGLQTLIGSGGNSLDWSVNELQNGSTPILSWKKHQLFNTWTNTGSFAVLGNLNVIGSIGTTVGDTNIFTGLIMGNTNEIGSGITYSWRLLPSRSYFNIESISDATGARLAVGGKDRGTSWIQLDSISGIANLHAEGGATSLNIGDGNTDQVIFTKSANKVEFFPDGATSMLKLTDTQNTYGFDDTSTHFVKGKFGIGVSSPLAKLHGVTTNVTVAATPLEIQDEYGTAQAAFYVGRHARGTVALPTALQADDSLVSLNGRGYGTTAFSAGRAIITGRAGEIWTDTAQGAYWSFFTTTNTTAVATESMRLDDKGNLGVGTTSPQTRLHSAGPVRIDGTVFYKLAVTGTNYTSSANDYIVAYKTTTLATQTNFLPAISTTITNGFTLVIKDAQCLASATNIVIFPSGSDTIDNAANAVLNANGQSVTISVDAVNKNWIKW